MTDRFTEIKNALCRYAAEDENIKAVIAIGSSTRRTVKADQFSDLDVAIVTEHPESWFCGEYPQRIGNVSISFVEPTISGGRELRCMYDKDKDVDMLILMPEQVEASLKDGSANLIMNRGYAVLYDAQNYTELIRRYVSTSIPVPDIAENGLINLVNDFFFHVIWAKKKLLRGELWASKMCIDTYLKGHLLKMMELYYGKVLGKDVWHAGRFLDSWADADVLEELRACFAHYDADDMKNALVHTHELFAALARKTAQELHYAYPEKAQACAEAYLNRPHCTEATQ